jgi:ABC-2 type transport system permease protein
VTPAFRRQLRWELRKLWRRPRSYVGFAAALVFQAAIFGLFQLGPVRERVLKTVWRLYQRFGVDDVFSALSSAVEVTGQTMMFVGAVSLALVGSDVVAKEAEDGTLRMVFCRPVTRTSVLLQKLIACALYTVALCAFVAASAFLIGLVIEGPGPLVILTVRESLFGVHEFGPGLARYALAIPLLAAGFFTVALLAFTLACLPVKPATAAVVAIIVVLADWAVQMHPTFAPVAPYTLMTRISSWRQVFNDTIPWLRLERNYSELFLVDVTLLAVAWWAFLRRRLTPR